MKIMVKFSKIKFKMWEHHTTYKNHTSIFFRFGFIILNFWRNKSTLKKLFQLNFQSFKISKIKKLN